MKDMDKDMIIAIGLKVKEQRNTEYFSTTAFTVPDHFDTILFSTHLFLFKLLKYYITIRFIHMVDD